MIQLDDLIPIGERKEYRHTFVVGEADDRMLREARLLLGQKNVAEIIRRSVRAGVQQALDKFRPENQDQSSSKCG